VTGRKFEKSLVIHNFEAVEHEAGEQSSMKERTGVQEKLVSSGAKIYFAIA
jgi:hypothetical protein